MASTSSSSSSTPSTRQRNYDVFLSFRGEDTRYTFTDHLHEALVRRGIRTFRDDQLERGEEIAQELLKVIEESGSSIIVFSENYAGSRWCLDELVKIMECKKDLGHNVFPIFYHVDPSDVRNQTGSFGEAFAGYEENRKDKVGRWRTALTEAANLSGWHLPAGSYESDHIKEMANNVFRRLNCKRFDVGANLVGIDSRIKKMILQLHMESSDVRIVGICGVGGIGKTTIAKVVYNKLSCEFEYVSFLESIREVSNTRGLPHLQNQLLGDILDKERSQNINSVDHGASMIETILSSKRVFIVLDDVDHLDQLESLLRNRGWLGKGSRVIITTRNKHLLTIQEVDDIYEVEGLNFEEAYTLFNLYAFKQNLPKSDFENLSSLIVSYCQGLPLALKVLGSLLFEKTIPQWVSELRKLEREPEVTIHKVLKRSYDGLGHSEKNIFLDVACFFKDEKKDFVSGILDGCYFNAEIGIKNLNDKCLITLPDNHIRMHDLIRQMGWEVIRENFPNDPNKWSRLWDPCDIERALTTYEGIKGVETISLDLSKLKRVRFNSNVFAKMARLRLLKVHSSLDSNFPFYTKKEEGEVVMKNASKMQLGLDFEFPSYELRYLYWDGYPLHILPSNFDGENLVELHLKFSNIKQLWQGNKDLGRLKVIDLSYSKKLVQMPEFSSMSNLETLILKGCVSLIDIHPSVGVLKKLTTLILRGCDKLEGLPSSITNLESLDTLDLFECSSFDKFSEIQGNMRSLREPYLKETTIKELPISIGNSRSLWNLDLCRYSNFEKFPRIQGNMRGLRSLILSNTAIRELPSGIDLKSVEFLDLSNCSKFEKFPENGANMKSLRDLRLKNTAIKELPTGIGNWESLLILDLSGYSNFEKFPEIQGNMRSLREVYLNETAIRELPSGMDFESVEIFDLSDCSKFEKFPEDGANMKSLRDLRLKNTAIKELPTGIGNWESLPILDLSGCSNFEKFSEIQGNMRSLREVYLKETAIRELPSGMDFESVEILDLSDCSKFEKFPENGANMKGLRNLRLKNTAIKELPTGIGNWESLPILDLSGCSNFEKFPEIQGNMRSLREVYLKETAIRELPSGLDFESVEILDLSDCSKFEKFPENGANMKSLRDLRLKNTAIKELPTGIGNWESLPILDLSGCSNFEKFPEIQGKMRSLRELYLRKTAIRELPSGLDLESLEFLDLSDCSKFEKFPENGANMKSLGDLRLRNTAIKELPTGIGNWESLQFLDLSGCSNFEKFPEIQGNMRSLRKVYLKETAIRELPSGLDLESVDILDLSDCSKFEKFPENGANMKSLRDLRLKNTAIKELPTVIGNWESLQILDLSGCSNFEKFPEIQGNMRSLREVYLKETAIRELPSGLDLESVEILDLSDCSKFEKFPENGANMKSLRDLRLKNTAIKELPTGIGNWESLPILDLSGCSNFEKFSEIQGNMRSLREVYLKETAIRELPSGMDFESVEILDLSDCSKFEKFPENGANMKRLRQLHLKNTAIKELPTGIANWESLWILDLSGCSNFEKFPEIQGNMRSLQEVYLKETAIRELPSGMDLESVEILDLSDCSMFEKFPEMMGRMKHLRELNLRRTAIEELPSSIDNLSGLRTLDIEECKNLRSLPDNICRLKFLEVVLLSGCSDLWEGSIGNQLYNLGKRNISHWKTAGQILKLPSSLIRIDAKNCTSKEDLSSLLWLCHLNWLKSVTEELKCWKLSAVIPESSGIPEWIRHENLGSEVTTELPVNWYEDPNFLGFVVSCVYQPIPTSADDPGSYHSSSSFVCNLNLHGNGFGFKDQYRFSRGCECPGNFNDMIDQVWVWWYPKIATLEEHHHQFTHFNASFTKHHNFRIMSNVKKCGVNLIFAGDHMPMLLNHLENCGDNGSALQDTNGNVCGADQDDEHYHIPYPMLDLLGNFGVNGSVVLEESNGNRKRSRDESLPHAVEEPQYKRLGAPMLSDLLVNFGDNGSVVLEESDGNRKRSRDNSPPHAVEEPQYKRLAAPNTHLSL